MSDDLKVRSSAVENPSQVLGLPVNRFAHTCRERMRKPVRHIGEPATLDELALLVAALPARLRLMIELAAWCALPFGEVAEPRRGDIDLKNGVIRVTRAVQWVDGTKIVAAPKADSARVVAFPPHIGEAAGRPDLRFHDLRHTGATLAAASGAPLAELMQRLGHTTGSAARGHQHAAQGSDKRIAAQLSEIALGRGES